MNRTEDAKAFMTGLLSRGPLNYRRVVTAMTEAGYSRAEYRAAKAALEIVTFTANIAGASYALWALPGRLDTLGEED